MCELSLPPKTKSGDPPGSLMLNWGQARILACFSYTAGFQNSEKGEKISHKAEFLSWVQQVDVPFLLSEGEGKWSVPYDSNKSYHMEICD